jgi:hypothetical protein
MFRALAIIALAARVVIAAPAPTEFPTPAPIVCATNTTIVDDLSAQLPVLNSVDLQDEYTNTLFTVAVADFFSSSLYADDAGALVQRVYWRDATPAEYTASNQQFRMYEFRPLDVLNTTGAPFNASRVVDVAAAAMSVEGRVLMVLATADRMLQSYILDLSPAPLTNVTVVALNATLVNQTECAVNSSAARTLLVDIACDWAVSPANLSSTQCYVFSLQCGTLHTHVANLVTRQLDATSCVHYEYNYTDALSLQVVVPAFPSTTTNGVLLTHALVAVMYMNPAINVTEPAWLFATHLCQPAFPLGNATLSSTLAYFERSGVAADDAGVLILRTELNGTTPLGAYRTWMLIASPFYGNQVEFFDPIDRAISLHTVTLPTSSIIRRLAGSRTDYTLHNIDALFVATFYAPDTQLVAGAFRNNGSVFAASIALTGNAYDSQSLDMGSVYEFSACARPLPLVSATLDAQGGSDVLLFNFTDPLPTPSPTLAPTASPLPPLNQEPIRDRTDIPLPNSVIGGAVFRGECADNTWARPGADPHRDDCDPYSSVASNNLSKSVWFSFETQLEPSVYMIYTDPALDTCENPETVPHPAMPIGGTVVSLWGHCYYYSRIPANGVDTCGSDPVDGMSEEHGFIGPVCLLPDTQYHIRVRGDTPEMVGEFDINVEEWTLRRGGDHCAAARPLDHIVDGVNDLSSCKSAVYTNLCAPKAGRDLSTKCPAVGGEDVSTTWFSYETRSFAAGPSELSFDIRFDDNRSMTTNGTLPFTNADNTSVSVTLSVWRACETLLEQPLLCVELNGTLDPLSRALEFATQTINESITDPYVVKNLRPHTTYYIALSTRYRGDFGLCAREIQEAPNSIIQTELCNTEASPGNCSNVCEAVPCNSSLSLNATLFVQRFDRALNFSVGDYGPALAAKFTGIDVTARGRACRCCMQPMLFDTSNYTGDDCELATPNLRFENGSGCGAGGAEGEGANFRDLGLCLIVSEDGDSIDPDSLRASGVVLEIAFCTTAILEYIVFINARKGTKVTLFDAAGEDYPSVPVRDLGANSVFNMTFNNPMYAPPFVSKIEIEYGEGGACIAEFAYRIVELNALCGCDPAAPMPSIAPPTANLTGPGACCYNGGSSCADYQDKIVCDAVQHGRWFRGRACAEGNFCPNGHAPAGELFGWQHDNTPIDIPSDLLSVRKPRHHWGYSNRPSRSKPKLNLPSSSSSSSDDDDDR